MNAVFKHRSCWALTAILLALAVQALLPAAAQAQLLDPATLHINDGTAYLLSNEVHAVTSGQVSVTNQSGGASDLNTPWLIIVGVADSSTLNATITNINGNPYSISHNSTTATMVSGQEAYTQLGLDAGTNNSNSFKNWHDWEVAVNGLHPTSFTLFEYEIPVTLSGGGTDTFTFDDLPLGAFVIAYGQTSTYIYDTPFTESGLVTGPGGQAAAPAPSSAILAGLGGLGLVGYTGYARRRRVVMAA